MEIKLKIATIGPQNVTIDSLKTLLWDLTQFCENQVSKEGHFPN